MDLGLSRPQMSNGEGVSGCYRGLEMLVGKQQEGQGDEVDFQVLAVMEMQQQKKGTRQKWDLTLSCSSTGAKFLA